MDRSIIHLDIPDFFAAMEETRNVGLKRKAFALAAPGSRSVIQGVNLNARKEGIAEGMALNRAKRLCRKLFIIPPDLRFYRDRHDSLLQDLDHYSPLVEGVHLGHFFIDVSGTRRLFGPPQDVAFSMEMRISREKGIHVRAGLAANKLVSSVAAHLSRPGDMSCVFPGLERPFLFPLPVTALPGVGDKMASRLMALNIERVGELAVLSSSDMVAVFGKTGLKLLRSAQGIDSTPVLPRRQTPKLCVRRNLERDEIDRDRLRVILLDASEEAGWELRCLNRYPGKFSLEVRYADGLTVKAEHAVSPIISHIDLRLHQAVSHAFDRLVQRRVAIRSIDIEFEDLSMPARQLSLFPWEEDSFNEDRRLQGALDRIRKRFGRTVIFWGRTANNV